MTNNDKGASAPASDDLTLHIAVQIPKACWAYKDDIRRFVDAMLYKMERNANKDRWEDTTIEKAFELLKGEVKELEAEVGGNSMKTILEAADVANFAMIIASIATERGK